MNRKKFLKATSLAAGAALIGPAVHAESSLHTALRRYIPMNRGWLFHPATAPVNTQLSFNSC